RCQPTLQHKFDVHRWQYWASQLDDCVWFVASWSAIERSVGRDHRDSYAGGEVCFYGGAHGHWDAPAHRHARFDDHRCESSFGYYAIAHTRKWSGRLSVYPDLFSHRRSAALHLVEHGDAADGSDTLKQRYAQRRPDHTGNIFVYCQGDGFGGPVRNGGLHNSRDERLRPACKNHFRR